MLTSEAHVDDIACSVVSPEALTAFCRRLANALIPALGTAKIEFHAVNDDIMWTVGPPGNFAMGIDFTSHGDSWSWTIREGLSYNPGDGPAQQCVSLTSLLDSELGHIAVDFARAVAAISTQLVFQNLYIPRAVIVADGYNDLKIAFRVVKSWDLVRSTNIVRVDFGMKNLGT